MSSCFTGSSSRCSPSRRRSSSCARSPSARIASPGRRSASASRSGPPASLVQDLADATRQSAGLATCLARRLPLPAVRALRLRPPVAAPRAAQRSCSTPLLVLLGTAARDHRARPAAGARQRQRPRPARAGRQLRLPADRRRARLGRDHRRRGRRPPPRARRGRCSRSAPLALIIGDALWALNSRRRHLAEPDGRPTLLYPLWPAFVAAAAWLPAPRRPPPAPGPRRADHRHDASPSPPPRSCCSSPTSGSRSPPPRSCSPRSRCSTAGHRSGLALAGALRHSLAGTQRARARRGRPRRARATTSSTLHFQPLVDVDTGSGQGRRGAAALVPRRRRSSRRTRSCPPSSSPS